MNEQLKQTGEHLVQAGVKVAPAVTPGSAVLIADMVDLINGLLSVVFMGLSIVFLLWRWKVAYDKEKAKDNTNEVK